jgi:hypothetical protein
MVWVSNDQQSKDLFVGLFNIGETEQEIPVDLSALNLKGKVLVRDLWLKKDAGVFRKLYKQKIPAHGQCCCD